jgi:transcriptional regulator with XRE-family HTH domain
VSIYFAQNLKHLRKRSSRTQEQLGQDVRLGRTTIANYEAGLSSPTDPEVLVRLSHIFEVSIDELLTRDLSVAFASTVRENSSSATVAAPPQQGYPKTTIQQGRPPDQHAAAAEGTAGTQVVFIPKEAAGAYASRHNDAAWLAELPLYMMPGLRSDTHRLFEVADASMAPRFSAGDRVVCRRVSSTGELQDGHPYVLVTATGHFLRRVLNRMPAQGGLQLVADEPGFSNPSIPAAIRREELLELWSVEWVISTNLAPPLGQVYARIADLEQQLRAWAESRPDSPARHH